MPASSKIIIPCWKKPILRQPDIGVTTVYFRCVLEGVRQAERAGVCPRPNLQSTCESQVLSKCLSRRLHKACGCGLEDMVSCMSPNKTTENTHRVNHSAVTGRLCESQCYCRPIYLATPFCQGAAVSSMNGSSRPSLYP